MKRKLVLKKLLMQNIATFDQKEVFFTTGLNVIIGETGSGKSLILDALALVLGERADKKIVRLNHDHATVEATFETQCDELVKNLEDLGYPTEGKEIIIKRIIHKEGKNKCFINHFQCPLNILQNFCREYVDLVGQFENQKLLSPSYQLQLLDSTIENFKEKKQFVEKFKLLKNLELELQTLELKKVEREQRIDFLKYQLEEINQLNPSLEEEERLLNLKKNIKNKEHKNNVIQLLRKIFDGDDAESNSLKNNFHSLKTILFKNKDLFPAHYLEDFAKFTEEFNHFYNLLINSDDPDMENASLDQVIDKLDKYQKIKRKHGGTIDAVVSQKKLFEQELLSLENLEQNFEILHHEIKNVTSICHTLADSMHLVRKKHAQNLSRHMTQGIQFLKMEGAVVDIQIHRQQDLCSSGWDQLYFLVQTNIGEGFHVMNEIVSGGELSRILLVLRQLSVDLGKISIFLFDEVDAGIGGETALAIGRNLKILSTNLQVLAISHLPQIASQADHLIKVAKKTIKENAKDRTQSEIFHFTKNELIKDEARKMVLLQ